MFYISISVFFTSVCVCVCVCVSVLFFRREDRRNNKIKRNELTYSLQSSFGSRWICSVVLSRRPVEGRCCIGVGPFCKRVGTLLRDGVVRVMGLLLEMHHEMVATKYQLILLFDSRPRTTRKTVSRNWAKRNNCANCLKNCVWLCPEPPKHGFLYFFFGVDPFGKS